MDDGYERKADIDISSYEREMRGNRQQVPLVATSEQIKSEDLWLNNTLLQGLNVNGILARVLADRTLSKRDKSLKKLFLQYIGKHIQNPRHFYEHWRQIGREPSWFHKAMALFKPDEITPEQKKAIVNFVSSMTMHRDIKEAAERGEVYNSNMQQSNIQIQPQIQGYQDTSFLNQGINEYDDFVGEEALGKIDSENRLRNLERGRSNPDLIMEPIAPDREMAPPDFNQQIIMPQQPQQVIQPKSKTMKLSNILFNPNRITAVGVKTGESVNRKRNMKSVNKFDRTRNYKNNDINIANNIPTLELPKLKSHGIDIKINMKGTLSGNKTNIRDGLSIDTIRKNIQKSKLKPFKINTSNTHNIMSKRQKNKKYNKNKNSDFGIKSPINKAMNIGKLEFKEAIMIHDKAYKNGENMKNSYLNLSQMNLKIPRGSLFPDIKGLGKVSYNFNIGGNNRKRKNNEEPQYVDNITEFYEGDD